MNRRVFPLWPAFAVLFGAALYLTVRWDSIPERWVIHWGLGGRPNGWTTRSISGVYGLLGVGVAAVVVLETASAIARVRVDAADSTAPVRAATTHLLRLIAFGLSVLVSVLSMVLPLGPALAPPSIVAIAVACVGLPILGGVIRLSAELRAAPRDGGLEGYHGLYYSNAKDRRLWVPKLSGAGLTINFAHPWAWPVMVLLVGLPIAIAAVSVLATR